MLRALPTIPSWPAGWEHVECVEGGGHVFGGPRGPSIAQGPAGLSSGAESRKNLHNTDHGASEESLNMHWCPMEACWGHSSLNDT